METNVKTLLETLNQTEIEAKRDYCLRIDSLRERLNMILLESWEEVKNQSLLTRSILNRLEGYYRYAYEDKEIRERGTIGIVVGDYFEDLIADTLRRYLKSVFKKQWTSGMLRFFRNKRIKNVIPDIVVQVRGVSIIAIEVKVKFGGKELWNAEKVYKNLSSKGVEYFVIASSFNTEPFGIYVGEEKQLDWLCVLAEWRSNESHEARHIKTIKFCPSILPSIELLLENILKVISQIIQRSWLEFLENE